MPPRVVHIVHTIGPYHDARLRAAARLMPIHAVELSRQSDTYGWDRVPGSGAYERTTLGEGRTLGGVLAGELVRRDTVVAIPGWSRPEALRALAMCLRAGVPTVMLSESQSGDAPRRATAEAVKRFVVRSTDAAFVGGRSHSIYLQSLGMPAGRISRGYDAVDNAYFAREAASCRANADAMRASLGLPDRYILSCARFVPKKNLPALVEAFAILQRRGRAQWSLVLVGDGPERGRIEEAAQRLGVARGVVLPGFRQISELPAFYALADVFVLPSLVEPWGLVVNEAMACGLPVVVSERAGCARDLVRALHGRSVDPTSPTQIANAIEGILGDGAARAAMGAAAARHIRQWGTGRFARGLLCAAEAACRANPGPRRARAAMVDLIAGARERSP